MLRIRYVNGDEEEVCTGAVHRPCMLRVDPPKRQPSKGAPTLAAEPERPLSPLPAFDGHDSRVEEESTDSTAESDSESSPDSDSTMSSTRFRVVNRCTERRRDRNDDRIAGSDSTILERAWHASKRVREAEDITDIQLQRVGSHIGEGTVTGIDGDVVSLGPPVQPNTSGWRSHRAATSVPGQGGTSTHKAARSKGRV
jgi:hypothetical protein